jgi:hypothetical protein
MEPGLEKAQAGAPGQVTDDVWPVALHRRPGLLHVRDGAGGVRQEGQAQTPRTPPHDGRIVRTAGGGKLAQRRQALAPRPSVDVS